MRLLREYTGEPITLRMADQLGVGGEARILTVLSDPDLVAKIYHRPDSIRGRKLRAMLANPPDDPMAGQAHISIAWPVDRLTSAGPERRCVGYLMPRVSGTLPVFEYYNPASRRKHAPYFTYQYLLRAARNLAAAVRALHSRGYVVGDLNESNILVTETALVTLVDTDSFQVPEAATGSVYRCTVGKPEYTPPELQGKTFGEIDRRPEHDLFGLAILLFQLLMEGTHPFAGEYMQHGDPLPYYDRISSGHFAYGSLACPYRPARAAPPLETLHPTLHTLMLQCFEQGHSDPPARPDANTWIEALQEAERQLRVCSENPRHYYGSHLAACPWCERAAVLGGFDPFPATPEIAFQQEKRLAHSRQPLLPVGQATVELSGHARIPVGSSPPSSTGVSVRIPTSPWSWAAVAASMVGVAAYQSGVPGISLTCALAAAGFALGAVATRIRHAGAWLAVLCLPAGAMTAMDSAIDLKSMHVPLGTRVMSVVSGVQAVAFSPDGTKILTGTDRAEDQRLIGGEVQEWDLKTGRLVQTVAREPGDVSAVAFTPDSKSVVIASYSPMESAHLDLVDARFQDIKTPIEIVMPGQPSLALSHDGRRLAVGSLSGTVDIIDPGTQQRLRRVTLPGEVLALSYAPDAGSIAVATGSPPGSIVSGTVTVINAVTGRTIWSKPSHGNAVRTVMYSPDGRTIASGGNDQWLRLWDAASGRQTQQVEVHTVRIATLAYSPDGKILAVSTESDSAGGADYDVMLWSVGSWAKPRILAGHRARVTCLAFNPKGDLLASGGLDDSVRLWKVK